MVTLNCSNKIKIIPAVRISWAERQDKKDTQQLPHCENDLLGHTGQVPQKAKGKETGRDFSFRSFEIRKRL